MYISLCIHNLWCVYIYNVWCEYIMYNVYTTELESTLMSLGDSENL